MGPYWEGRDIPKNVLRSNLIGFSIRFERFTVQVTYLCSPFHFPAMAFPSVARHCARVDDRYQRSQMIVTGSGRF